MILGIDVRPLQGETKHRGIGKALGRTLVPLFRIGAKAGDEFVLYYDPLFPKPIFPTTESRLSYHPLKTPKINKKKYVRVVLRPFKKINIKKGSVDVLLQFDFGLGVPKSVPTVVMFHDLIPVLFRKDDLNLQKNQTVTKKIKQSLGGKIQWKKYISDLNELKNAKIILAISNSSKHDLVKYFPSIKEKEIKIAHLGVDRILSTSKQTANNNVKKITQGTYLLYVGGIDIRKNIMQLVKDFFILKPNYPDLKLVLVGKEFELKENLKKLGWTREVNKNIEYKKDIIILGYVSDYELETLYKNALVFVFPSLYEGFGLPILEAMALGCPTIAYSNSSIPEVAGDASLLQKNGTNLSVSIKKLIENPKLRENLIEKGIIQASKFPWSNTAKVIHDEMHKSHEK